MVRSLPPSPAPLPAPRPPGAGEGAGKELLQALPAELHHTAEHSEGKKHIFTGYGCASIFTGYGCASI